MITALALALAMAAPPKTPALDAGAFARAVSAVIDPGTPGAKVRLIETDTHGVEGLRTLKVGDEYQSGWILTALTPQEAVLRKGKGEQRIRLGGLRAPGPALPPQIAAAVPPPAAVSGLSNAGRQMARPRSPLVNQAIAKGDAAAVLANGGSPQDAVEAIRNLTREQVRTNRPNLATYLNLFADTSDGSTFETSSRLNGRQAITRIDARGNPTMQLTVDGAFALTLGPSPQQEIISRLPPQNYTPPPAVLPAGTEFRTGSLITMPGSAPR